MRLPFGMSNSSGLARRLLMTTMGSAVVRVLGMAVTFLVGVQLARYLGPKGYGDYGTVMAIVAMLVVPAQLGLPQLMTRELAAFTATGGFDRVKGTIVWFAAAVLTSSVVIAATAKLGLHIWHPSGGASFSRAFAWGLLSIPLTALVALGVSALRGFHHVTSAQVYDALLRPAIFAALLFAAGWLKAPVDAGTALAFQAISACLLLLLCAGHLLFVLPSDVRQARSSTHVRRWAASAMPMAGTEVLRVFDGQYAVLLLGLLASMDQVGIFRIALACAAFIALPSTLLNVVVMPYTAQFHAAGARAHLQKIAAGSAFAMFVSVAAVTIGVALFGKSLIAAVFGSAFAPAQVPLVLMGVAYSINGFFGSAATILNMCDQERTVIWVYVIGPAIGVVVTLLTFHWFGISSVAVAMILAEIIKGLIMRHTALKKLGIDPSVLGAAAFLSPRVPHAPMSEART